MDTYKNTKKYNKQNFINYSINICGSYALCADKSNSSPPPPPLHERNIKDTSTDKIRWNK